MKRRRGRPPGARSSVLREGLSLGPRHFAFLRACYQGVDPRRAWERYLSEGDPVPDVRTIERQRAALLRGVLAAGHGALRGAHDAALRNALALLERPARVPDQAPIPTLDEWAAAEGFDAEWSENELMAMYREHFGLETLAEESLAPQLRRDGAAAAEAVNVIARHVRRVRSPADAASQWFAPRLVAGLDAAGIPTLGELARRVAAAGPRWHEAVTGLGARRAASIVRWLHGQQDEVGAMAGEDALPATGVRQLARPASSFQDVLPLPLERMPPGTEWSGKPPALASSAGRDDLAAIRAWLSAHEAHGHTHRAYRKEAERFYLWCRFVARKPMVAITPSDCAAYEAFLGAPADGWVEPRSVPRKDAAWRPFRKPLSSASRSQAMTVVRILFDALLAAGHVAVNPLRAGVEEG